MHKTEAGERAKALKKEAQDLARRRGGGQIWIDGYTILSSTKHIYNFTDKRDNMALIQSTLGRKGSFEFLVPEQGNIRHYYRDNDDPELPWIKGVLFGPEHMDALYPSLIQGNFGKKGSFEVVVRERAREENFYLRHYYRDNDDPELPWIRGERFGHENSGNPALIQSNLGKKGSFEVVVTEGDHLQHYYRDNDDPELPWYEGASFGHDIRGDPALIQSNLGKKGSFEVVVTVGNHLQHYYRNNDDPELPWYEGASFGHDINGNPALIQSNFGKKGSFEVVVTVGDHLQHYYRNNDDPQLPWYEGASFGHDISDASPGLIQSNFGKKRNFEVVAGGWHGYIHYSRDNDDPKKPWKIAGILPK